MNLPVGKQYVPNIPIQKRGERINNKSEEGKQNQAIHWMIGKKDKRLFSKRGDKRKHWFGIGDRTEKQTGKMFFDN